MMESFDYFEDHQLDASPLKESISASSKREEHAGDPAAVLCDCDNPVVQRRCMSNSKGNYGREYFVCAKPRRQGGCSFFRWTSTLSATKTKKGHDDPMSMDGPVERGFETRPSHRPNDDRKRLLHENNHSSSPVYYGSRFGERETSPYSCPDAIPPKKHHSHAERARECNGSTILARESPVSTVHDHSSNGHTGRANGLLQQPATGDVSRTKYEQLRQLALKLMKEHIELNRSVNLCVSLFEEIKQMNLLMRNELTAINANMKKAE